MSRSCYSLTETVRVDVPSTAPMTGYLARPAGRRPTGSVIVGMELFGVSAHVRDICDRLAALGYLALAPDLYHRTAPGVELPADDAGRERGFQLLTQLTRPQVIDDIRAATTFLNQLNVPLVGMVGLSVGGHVAYLAAEHLPLPAIVVCYGGWLPTTEITMSQPEPTLAATSAIHGRVLMLIGGKDALIPPQQREQITDALTAARVEHRLVVYPEAGHGFLCHRRGSFHPEAANAAWKTLTHFLAPGETIPGP